MGERAWRVVGRAGVYCHACREAAPACTGCGAPTRSPRLRDGRPFCPSCAASLVEDRAAIEALYRELLREAGERLSLQLEKPPRLHLESEADLRARPGTGDAPEGLCGVYVRDGEGAAAIHLLVPLPRARLTAVIAHEIGHAWQAEHCPDAQGPRLREGFAEWVSWRLLAGRPECEEERRAIEARTDLYGDGFRVFAALDAQGGADASLWYARAARNAD